MFIATKPTRFDKDYYVGDKIPDNVIDPNMVKRLVDWGKIAYVPDVDNVDDEVPTITEDTSGDTDEMVITEDALDTDDETGIPSDTPGASENESNDEEEETTPSADETPENETQEDNNDGETTSEYVCEVCGKICATKTGLIAHAKTHDR